MSTKLIEEKADVASWVFDGNAMGGLLGELGFDGELRGHLCGIAREVGRSAESRGEFLKWAEPWLRDEVREVPEAPSDWQALIAVAGLREMVCRHRRRRIPADITGATARDLERRMKDSRVKGGEWGFDRLRWMGNHVHRNLLEIGRLQFLPAAYRAPYRVYTARGRDGQSTAFPQGGLVCSEEGWMEKGARGFTTHFSVETGEICGNPVDPKSGRIQKDLERLDANEHDLRLSPESQVLHVHIPSGARLSAAACEESLREAGRVFNLYFPEISWAGWTCTSWLLDREVAECLPPDSNIVAFGKLFSPLATPNTDSRQIMERVLGSTADWRHFQPQTSLQKAVIQHLAAGRSFRTTSGFILRD